MADGPQSEAPSGSFLRALTIAVPVGLRHSGEFGRLVCVDGFERIWSTASATSLSRSVFCFNFP